MARKRSTEAPIIGMLRTDYLGGFKCLKNAATPAPLNTRSEWGVS